MKNICTAVLFLVLGINFTYGQQQDLSKMKVSYLAGKIPAAEAIESFLAENKIKSYAYSKEYLKNYKIQGVKCTDESVLDCANNILKGLPFEVIIYNNTLIIRQKIRKNTVATDIKDDIPLLSTLQKQKDTIITEKETKIDEITINAGYYAVKDKERTGSISKVTAKDIENQPVTNVFSALQGRMSGVSITQNSGMPGGGFDIQIRGRNSLRTKYNSDTDGNQPLYIIDGVPVGGEITSLFSSLVLPAHDINPLNAINPNDIESIEILKDADATAIYGSRGANGVVLVTTKKGKKGAVKLTLNTFYAISSTASKLKMMNTPQYLQMRRQAYQNDGVSFADNDYDVNGTWSSTRSTDWQKQLIGKYASNSMIQASVSGGNEETSFLLSTSHTEQTTVLPADFKYTTNSLNGTLTHRSKDKRFELTTSNLFSHQKNNVINEDLTAKALILSPNAPALYLQNGDLNWENNTFTNPVASFVSAYSYTLFQFNNNINARYELFPNLSFKINGGLSYSSFEELSLRPNTMYNPSYGLTSAYSSAMKNNQTRFSYLLEPQLNWQYKKENHQLDVLIGTTLQKTSTDQSSLQGYGFTSNALIENLGAANIKIVSDEVKTDYNYFAVFGRINYQYMKKYILNVTGRRDGSSRFGPNNRFANFGALGTAWLFSKENWFGENSMLSFGKLRASYGITGSDLIGDYQYLNTYSSSGTGYDGTVGFYPSRLYNPNFSWEKTTKTEAALELGFFKDRLNINAAWYRNLSSNQLVGIPLPGTTGFNSIQSNLPATVENKGLEFEISARPLNQNLKWQSSFNISIPTNKLIAFPNLEGSTYANQYIIGYPTSIVKLYQYEGIDPATGLYKFKDFNGDGKITTPDDSQAIEKLGIKYFGGWQNQLSYKQWSLSFLLQFVHQTNWNYNRQMPIAGSMNNQPREVLNVWSAENQTGTYMPYSTGLNPQKNELQSFFQNSTAAIGDASFIRLKNIQLNYKLNLNKAGIDQVLMYIQGQNLITWTKYFGLDPEFSLTGFLPPLKTYSFGLQLNF
nr:SusC/RagA family TonB-linked outer membrane protein [Pedobacter sp. ASV2]